MNLHLSVPVALAVLAAVAFPGQSWADDASHDIKVDFPHGSPGHHDGGTATINICPFDSFDQLENHFDGSKGSKVHDDVDKAFEDAIKTGERTKDDAFDLRHHDCPDHHGSSHHDSSSSDHHETQTKVVPHGSVDAGDGSTDTGSGE